MAFQDEINNAIASRSEATRYAANEKRAAKPPIAPKPILTDREIIKMRRERFARKGDKPINVIDGVPVKANGDYIIKNFFHYAMQTADGLQRPIHFAQPSYLTLVEMQGAIKFWAARSAPKKQRIKEAGDNRDMVSALYLKFSRLAPEYDSPISLPGEVKYTSFRGARQRSPNFGPFLPSLFPESMLDPVLDHGEDIPVNRNDRVQLAESRIAKWQKKIAIEEAAIKRANSQPATAAKSGAAVVDPSGPPRGQGGQAPITIEEVEKL